MVLYVSKKVTGKRNWLLSNCNLSWSNTNTIASSVAILWFRSSHQHLILLDYFQCLSFLFFFFLSFSSCHQISMIISHCFSIWISVLNSTDSFDVFGDLNFLFQFLRIIIVNSYDPFINKKVNGIPFNKRSFSLLA